MKYCWLLQILLLITKKSNSLSDEFILEQFQQHSERIRRLEAFCNLTDDLSSRELRQKEDSKVNSISNALTLLQFSNTVYLIFQNLLADQHRKKASSNSKIIQNPFFSLSFQKKFLSWEARMKTPLWPKY